MFRRGLGNALPPDSPLWDVENLLITPHIAGLTDKVWHRH